MPPMRSEAGRYALIGACLGICFPVFSTWFHLHVHGLGLSLSNIALAQAREPLLWVIDATPFLLGLFAYYAGRYQDQSGIRNQHLEKDVTQRSQELDQAHYDLKVARNLAKSASGTRTEFLANVNHELRTPMNMIMGLTDLALKTDLNDEQREYLNLIASSSDALLRLVEDILDVSRIEQGMIDLRPSVFRLRTNVADIVAQLMMRAENKGLELTHAVDHRIPDLLVGDWHRIRQIIVNLVENAIKFTEEGGISLAVDTSRTQAEDLVLQFSVSDTGIGIPKDKQALVFDVFGQVEHSISRRHSGLGLGLAISSRLAGLLGGTLWVESEPGRGSTFRFTAEVTRGSGEAFRVRSPSEESGFKPPLRHLRVLVAEDDVDNQLLVTRMLEHQGHQVQVANNGYEAVEAIQSIEFDLALMDVQMPEMDGLEATAKIREHEKQTGLHLPIVAVTAHAMPEFVEKCLAAGMDAYVSKPIRSAALFEAMEDAVRRCANQVA